MEFLKYITIRAQARYFANLCSYSLSIAVFWSVLFIKKNKVRVWFAFALVSIFTINVLPMLLRRSIVPVAIRVKYSWHQAVANVINSITAGQYAPIYRFKSYGWVLPFVVYTSLNLELFFSSLVNSLGIILFFLISVVFAISVELTAGDRELKGYLWGDFKTFFRLDRTSTAGLVFLIMAISVPFWPVTYTLATAGVVFLLLLVITALSLFLIVKGSGKSYQYLPALKRRLEQESSVDSR